MEQAIQAWVRIMEYGDLENSPIHLQSYMDPLTSICP